MRYVLLAILWSIPQVILQMSVLYVVFRAFSLDLPYGELLCMQTMLQASVCFIPLPGASGAQELGFSMFFKSYFASGDILYTAVLVWRFFTYYIIVLLGALVVVIDQLVFWLPQKAGSGALCRKRIIRLASAQLVGAALFFMFFYDIFPCAGKH